MSVFSKQTAFLAEVGAMIARITAQVVPDVAERALVHALDRARVILVGHSFEGARPPLSIRRDQWYNLKHGLMGRQRIFPLL